MMRTNLGSKRREGHNGQAATVVIFALIIGIIFMLLIPATSYSAQKRIERASQDIENTIRAHYVGEIVDDYLEDKIKSKANDRAYQLGLNGNGQRWNVTSSVKTKEYRFHPHREQFKQQFLSNLSATRQSLDRLSGCSLANNLEYDYALTSLYRAGAPKTEEVAAETSRGFSLSLDYADQELVTCEQGESVATYQPSLPHSINVTNNRYFVLANLSLTFVQLLAENITQEIAEGTFNYRLPAPETGQELSTKVKQRLRNEYEEEIANAMERMNGNFSQIINSTRNQSIKILLDNGFLVNETKGQISFDVNLSGMSVDFGLEEDEKHFYWRLFNLTLPVAVEDRLYQLPTSYGLANLTLAFPLHYQLTQKS